tara:strand:+ start:874 stop:1974 length:1101 start_codon:yes stop_codon:yes gene_type:complete
MKNFTKELKAIIKEDPGAPIMSPDEVIGRANTMVVLTNDAPRELLALAGPSRKAILLNFKPLMITFPDQKGVYQVQPDDIVFESHHTGRDVTEAGSEETSYEKFFASAMKKFGVSSPIDLSPEDTKKFFNYVDKNWEAEEESDGSKSEDGWDDPPRLGGEPSLITPVEGDEDSNEIAPAIAAGLGAVGAGAAGAVMDKITGDDNEDVSTGKVGKKDKGSYQKAYKLALKKYQIHSADELDTPAERKGFTAYVDKLWKGGEVKDHALESDMNEKRRKPKKKNRNKNKKNKANSDQAQRDRERDQQQAEREREREAERRDRDRERGQKAREDEKKDRNKKKSGGLGIGSALKDLGSYAISKAQASGGN